MVVDDQPVVRAGFAAILDAEPDPTVVGTASDGAAALDLAARTEPDVVLVDIRMPAMDGLTATARHHRCRIRSQGPGTDDVRPGRVRLPGAPRRRLRLPPQGRRPRRPW
jgi:CheY-like chemotaxis protein